MCTQDSEEEFFDQATRTISGCIYHGRVHRLRGGHRFRGPAAGPCCFGNPAQTLIYPDVTFTGGTILTNTANLPANQTSLYGTASFGNATYLPVLTATFGGPIQNFFLDVLNGMTQDVTYRLEDNNGHSAEFTLEPNLNSGKTQIGFAASGSVVTLFAKGSPSTWDFFIDNVHFNERLPPDLERVPEPSTWMMLGGGIGVLALRRRLA